MTVHRTLTPSSLPPWRLIDERRHGLTVRQGWFHRNRISEPPVESLGLSISPPRSLRIYERIPLTQIAREVGASVRMIGLHYAGVIANWTGKRVPSERQIRSARAKSGRGMDAAKN